MKVRHLVLLLVTLLPVGGSFGQSFQGGVLHLKFKASQSTTASQLKTRMGSRGAVVTGLPALDKIAETNGVVSMRRVFRESGKFEIAHEAYGLHLWYEIVYDSMRPASQVMSQLNGTGTFERVERVRKPRRILSSIDADPEPPPSALPTLPNDPGFYFQWHLKNLGGSTGTPGVDIDIANAWHVEAGNANVTVAIIDGGIDILHPDLTSAIWVNTDEIPLNNIDDDHNGYVDDRNGFGFGDGIPKIYPDFHGTHVAGIIGAINNNAMGVSGIAGGSSQANGVRLMSCAGFGNWSVGGFEDAFVYAADNGAVIAQNSWGGGSSAIEAAIDYFIARAGYDNSAANFNQNIQIGPMAGGVVVFAAGNANSSDPSRGYPGSYEPVIAVASTDWNDRRSPFSNYGPWIEISAPGSQIYSTFPLSLGSYATLSGTSMACPQVSGVAALIVSHYGGAGLLPESVRARLLEGAENIDALNFGYAGKLGSGRLNADNSIRLVDNDPPAPVLDFAITEEKTVSIRIGWTASGDDGNVGQATRYDIRYSTSPINAANFESAFHIGFNPKPKVAGSPETAQALALTPSTTYYFAMKVIDSFGNKSSLSNVVSGRTKDPGRIEITPGSISVTALTGATVTTPITVKNTGIGELVFSIEPISVPWITSTPGETLVPGTQTTTTVNFLADGLPAGLFSYDLTFSSNDPLRPTVVVPITLTVTSAPNLKVNVTSLDFGDVKITTSKSLSLSISNNGTQTLALNGATTSDPAFVLEPLPPSLAPGQSVSVTATFAPVLIQSYLSTIQLSTNDPDLPLKTIQLTGRGLDPPRLASSVDSLMINIYVGRNVQRTFNITNVGGLDLTSTVQVEYEQPNDALPGPLSVGAALPADPNPQVVAQPEQLAAGDFSLMDDSPAPLAAIVTHPIDSTIYGYSTAANLLFRYNPVQNAWAIVSVIPTQRSGMVGGVFISGSFYFSFADSPDLDVFNTADSTWSTIPLPLATSIITTDGIDIYFAKGNTFKRYSLVGDVWTDLASATYPFSDSGGLAYHRGILYGYEGNGQLNFSRYDITTNRWESLRLAFYGLTNGIAVDPIHERVYVSGTNVGHNLQAFDIRLQSWFDGAKHYFARADGGMAFLTQKGFAGLYYASGEDDIQFGRFEPLHSFYWLNVIPNGLTLASNASRQMRCEVEGKGLVPGEYSANIMFTHNDPFQPPKKIPVLIRVSGAPDFEASPNFMIFNNLYIGKPATQRMTISNRGTQVLSGTFRQPPSHTSLSSSTFSLAPGESVNVDVTHTPSAEGLVDFYLYIDTNDPDESEVDVFVSTAVDPAPALADVPGPISLTLPYGSSSTTSVIFQNLVPQSGLHLHGDAIYPSAFGGLPGVNTDGLFMELEDSPVPMTALVASTAGKIYGQEIEGKRLFTYDPTARSWSELAPSPLSSGGFAGAAQYDGKIYVASEAKDTLAIYSIANNSWETLRVFFPTANIAFASTVLGLALNRTMATFNFYNNEWSFSEPGFNSFTSRGGLAPYQSRLYGHVGHGFSGFGYYAPFSNGWSNIIPGNGMGQGATINLATQDYLTTYTLGDHYLVAYNLETRVFRLVPVPLFSTLDASMTYSNTAGTSGLYLTEGASGTSFGVFLTERKGWLSLSKKQLTATLASPGELEVQINTLGLEPGNYTSIIRLSTTDPDHPQLEIPVSLQVVAAPNISVENAAMSFSPVLLGESKTWAIQIENTGNAPLEISGIQSSIPQVTVESGPMTIAPGEVEIINANFVPTQSGLVQGMISISSNDPDSPTLEFQFTSQVFSPPVISSNPGQLVQNMDLDRYGNRSVQVSNGGGFPLNWTLSIGTPGGSSLERGVDSLNVWHHKITDAIPNFQDFVGGETGSSIEDGGNDLFDQGNMVKINNQSLTYTNKVITNAFNGRYFTAKYPGLFVLIGEGTNIFSFATSGQMGSGYNAVGGTSLPVVGRGYSGDFYYKYSLGPSKPTIHRIAIVTQFSSLSGGHGLDPHEDVLTVSPTGVKRIYYLMFVTPPQTALSDTAVQAVVSIFLQVASGEALWLTASTLSGTVQANTNQAINLTFSTYYLKNGIYKGELAFTSNDPAKPTHIVPVELNAYTNHAPVTVNVFASLNMGANKTKSIHMGDLFADPDGDPLIYVIASSKPDISRAELHGDSLKVISYNVTGVAAISITARDPGGLTKLGGFNVFVTKDITTGIEPDATKLSVAPNPATTEFTAVFTLGQDEEVIMSLENVQGASALREVHKLGAGTHHVRMPTENLPAGIYIFRFSAGLSQSTQKVVIVK